MQTKIQELDTLINEFDEGLEEEGEEEGGGKGETEPTKNVESVTT